MLRAFFQDLKLWGVYLRPTTSDRRQVQEHEGIDQPYALVIPTSQNHGGTVRVATVWEPGETPTWQKFRARERALRHALYARSDATGPVCIVDDAYKAVVSSFASGVLTLSSTPPYAFQVGDAILVRRLGVGLYTLALVAAVGSWPPYTVTLGTVVQSGGVPADTIQAGDDVHKVELAWSGLTFEAFAELASGEHGDYYSEEAGFLFRGLGAADDPGPTIDLDD